MNKTLLLCILLCGSLDCRGQTNAPMPFNRWYRVPALHLRTVVPEPRHASKVDTNSEAIDPGVLSLRPAPQKTHTQSSVQNAFAFKDSINIKSKAAALDMHRWLVRNGYLRPRPPESDNRLVRAMNAVFSPEIIHVGKISVACTLITAIKRKDPLCLLNPLFLSASW